MRRKIAATASAAPVPSRYIPSIVRLCRPTTPPTFTAGTNAPMSSAYTGSRAEQLINGTTMIVASRSSRCWIIQPSA